MKNRNYRIFTTYFVLFCFVALAQNNEILRILKSIHYATTRALVRKDYQLAIEEANKLEKSKIKYEELKSLGNKNLSEEQVAYLGIRKNRAEAYYYLELYPVALEDSKFVYEHHPNPSVYEYTRYAFSLYYSGDRETAFQILTTGYRTLEDEKSQELLRKTIELLFDY